MTLTGFESGAPEAEHFMELLMSEGAETVLSYQHSTRKKYVALRVMHMARCEAWYIGCMFEEKYPWQLFCLDSGERNSCGSAGTVSVIVREGINEKVQRFAFT